MFKLTQTFLFFLILFFLTSCFKRQEETRFSATKNINSVKYWFVKSKQKELNLTTKLNLLKKTNVSLKDSMYSAITISKCATYGKMKQYLKAIKEAENLQKYATQNNDSLLLANAFFRLGFYSSKEQRLDDSYKNYIKAYQLYLIKGDSLKSAQILGNISSLQNRLGDFISAQKTTTKAIELLNNRQDKKTLFNLYLTLANSFQNNLQFNEANESYLKSINFAPNDFHIVKTKNNIALNYKKQKEYSKSIQLYKKLLQHNIIEENPLLKARILDNYGHSLFLENNRNGLSYLLKAEKIKTKEKDNLGLFASYIHLTEYYLNKNKKEALKYAKKALHTSNLLKSADAKLEALKYLILIKQNPKEETVVFLRLKDSIELAQKTQHNKYAAVKFLSREKEKENLQLKAEKTQQELLTQKVTTRNWFLTFGLLGLIVFLFSLWRRYKSEQKAKRIIQCQKELIENLQKELHHRIKNNLAIINSFIDVAREEFTEPAFDEKLIELQNRIGSINEVHQQLHKNRDVTNLNIKKYIAVLVKNIEYAFANTYVEIQQNIPENLKLHADISFPIGLIVNEFLTNSYKHAFKEVLSPKITISITEKDKNYHLNLYDNGKGLAKDFDIKRTDSFGLRIMSLLAKQLKGSFEITSNSGTEVKIIFPK